jgi:SAM-dependent methyltransferase
MIMPPTIHSSANEPSHWVARHAHLIPAGGRALDLACGNGRHARYLRTLGHDVVAVDIDLKGVRDLAATSGVQLLQADLEGEDWPFQAGQFDAIVVSNYLHRPHFPHLISSLAPDGLLIFETFAAGNEKYGRPRNPDYLLQPNELLDAFANELEVIAYEQREVSEPRPAVRQRICARLPDPAMRQAAPVGSAM